MKDFFGTGIIVVALKHVGTTAIMNMSVRTYTNWMDGRAGWLVFSLAHAGSCPLSTLPLEAEDWRPGPHSKSRLCRGSSCMLNFGLFPYFSSVWQW